MAEPREGQRVEGGRGLDRILALSDGVFAIAMTLLVLNIEVPEIPEDLVARELPGALLDLWPKYLSYVISFLVILFYWTAHHSIFGLIKNHDKGLIWLNSLFLMFIAFLPFPTALLGEYGEQPLVVAIYAGSLAVTRLLLTAAWWYASGDRRLVVEGLDPGTMKAFSIRGLAIPLIFLISIVISLFSVTAAICSWLLLMVIDFVLLRVLRRYWETRR
jgi:uncharacterized membrane protein